jgi:DNA-binding transcriptional ArsR family regulator
MFQELDPLLHNQLRLSIMSLLIGVEQAEFNFLLEKTGATRGNLSVQINKLKEGDYIDVKKSFRKNYPLTTCKVTPKGIGAFEKYVEVLQEYLKVKKSE